MLNNWKTYKLGDLVTSISETFKFTDKKVVFLNTSDILENTFLHSNYSLPKSLPGQAKKTIKQNDLLFSEIRPANKRYAVVNFDAKDYVVSTKFMVLRIKEEKLLSILFFKYLLTNEQNLTNFQAIAENRSGTFPQITFLDIAQIEYTIPDLATQTQIAQILSSLDDKIELNLQMNQTLEAMAQALFKEWFVDFNFPDFDGELENGLPKGWKNCTIKDFGKIICGKTPSKAVAEYFGGEYMFIKIPNMHNSVFIIETTDSLTELGLNSQSNKTIPPYSICISSIATVGLVCINPKPCQTNQQINSIVPKNNFLKYYLYFLAISMKETFLAAASGGTTTLNMNTSQFSSLNAIMPTDEILKQFDEIISPIMAKILENNYQIQTLTQTRDALLPKLMSGKVLR